MAEQLNIDQCEITIIGTGLVESIIAGAFQRIDKLTLHLDANDYYGGEWSSHTLDGLEKWAEAQKESKTTESAAPANINGRKFVPLQYVSPYTNVEKQWHVPEDLEPGSDGRKIFKWTKRTLLDENKKFNIELSPKVLLSSGDMVELLISSGVSRYLEFKNVLKIMTFVEEEDRIVSVPCSRADVFSTDEVTVVEKRLFMKLMESCQNEKTIEAENKEFADKTFLEYLKYKKLTPRLIHYATSAITQTNETTPFKEGVERVQKFIKSLGRFGNSPYLWTQYGTGEIPQAFCRLCAVFGGVYYLNRDVDGLLVSNDNICTGIVTNGKAVDCNYCVLANGYIPGSSQPSRTRGISRAIFITDRSLNENNEEKVVVMTISGSEFRIFETGYETASAPKDIRIVHFFGGQITSAKEDIESLAKRFLNLNEEDDDEKPRVLWSLYFNTCQVEFDGKYPENVFHIEGPGADLDIDGVVSKAKEVYAKAYGDIEFLPKAPEPEDIILDDGDATSADKAEEEKKSTA
ncbi:rab proteins geranylgeranyltransferase component A 1-like [Artemia franciscana]|uniref:Rab proteins geranylgeranyltransferase component A n=1 Tax=Artemia franciscana TaxID=6661 RepID=A0AA88ISR2_ARTSF|nr:hypothetical protein QYM36_000523 [Artemia franciscana]